MVAPVVAGCGDPEVVTVRWLTEEFCAGVEGVLALPAGKRNEKFNEMNSRIERKMLEEDLDDEALAFNILAECGEGMIGLGAAE